MFKKITAVATCSMLTIAMGVTAFAAGSLNENENKIIAELEAKGVPASYVEQAKAEMLKDGVEITATQATTAIANIDEAKKIVEEKGYTSIAQLKADTETLNKVVALVEKTGDAVGVKVTVDVTTGKVTAATSATPAGSDSSIKTTGVDFSKTVAVVAGLSLSVAGLAVVAKKKDLVNA